MQPLSQHICTLSIAALAASFLGRAAAAAIGDPKITLADIHHLGHVNNRLRSYSGDSNHLDSYSSINEKPNVEGRDVVDVQSDQDGEDLPGITSSETNEQRDVEDAPGQQLAIASYINPTADPAAWGRLVSYNNSKVSVLVANILNGPDYVVNERWKDVITRAAATNKTVLGYVRTGYLGVSQQQFKTRLGSLELADWAAQIEQDIEQWYTLYGSAIGGIFFDEGWPECGPDNVYSDLYTFINRNTKRKHAGAFTVLNPGGTMAQCYENTMDTLMTFESSYEAYTTKYVPNTWTAKDSRKLWHIIYNVPADQVSNVAALAKQRGAGLVEITNGIMPNPYGSLPDEAYMQAAMDAVEGGRPMIADYVPGPSVDGDIEQDPAPVISSSEYSSVSLRWTKSKIAVGYRILSDGDNGQSQELMSLPASMDHVTVGGLQPGSSNLKFRVGVLTGDYSETDSNAIAGSTSSFPNGKPITNMQLVSSAGSLTVSADVLVPYAFVRLFLCCPFTNAPGNACGAVPAWPVRIATGGNAWCPYMVEGSNWFMYSGQSSSTSYP